MDFMKIKHCTTKSITKKVKILPVECKKFTDYMSDNGLVSRIYKEFLQLNNKKQTTQFKNGQMT